MRLRGEAQRRLTLLAVAAQRYRLKHGEHPSDVRKLAAEYFSPASCPPIPFDGQPLRMRLSEDGLVLYSVGEDGLDNGGQDPQNRGAPDIVVRFGSSLNY